MKAASRLQYISEYYFSSKLREIAQRKEQGEDILNFGIGNPVLPPPKKAVETFRNALLEDKYGYQPYRGIPAFRQSIATFYQDKYGVILDETKNILPLAGSKEAILLISMAFLNAGDKVLIPNPGYPAYTSTTHLMEAEPIYYTLNQENNYQPDLNFLEENFQKGAKLLWLNSPHMPTGSVLSLAYLQELIQLANRYEVIIVNDNPYSFISAEKPLSLFQQMSLDSAVLELNSLSKIFNIAGWRLGMLVGNNDLLEEVVKVKTQWDSGMNYAAQKAAIACLNLNDDWMDSIRKHYQTNREELLEAIENMPLKVVGGEHGMFIWTKMQQGSDDKQYVDELLNEYQVFLAPGSIFGSEGAGHIRLSLCANEASIEKLKQRLK